MEICNYELHIMNYELKYMYRCLQLAQYGAGYVAPNPMVGAVLVCDDRIIGESFHRHFGELHAEPNAINSVKKAELLKSATLYVNLEPCSHYGHTPPCADLIVKNAIPRVVIGTLDPNPKVAGRGVEILRKAGVELTVGVLEEECRELNKRFFIFQEKKRPYVLLKWAQTLDGFIDRKRENATEKPLLISNAITSKLTHKMRSENQSILVGANTVLLDNPTLTVRNWSGKSPVRVAIDRLGRIPDNYNIVDGNIPTLVFTEDPKPDKPHVEYVKIDFELDKIQSILNEIYKRNIHSVLVEGGSQILTGFIQSGLWDEANVEISLQKIGDGVAAPVLPVQPISRKLFDDHEWLFFKNSL
jgi:diaminohydroxyphosphoribosylaminopyrimidine deaminase/5-amino-6-(5-phosphoribosylamino)uracil reductase